MTFDCRTGRSAVVSESGLSTVFPTVTEFWSPVVKEYWFKAEQVFFTANGAMGAPVRAVGSLLTMLDALEDPSIDGCL